MAFNKPVPTWNAPGSEPPDSLKNGGFQAGYKPPAAYFNWFWHEVSEALKELQGMDPDDIGALPDATVPLAKGGTGATNEAGAVSNILIRNNISSAAVTDANTLTNVGIHKVFIDAGSEPADYHLPTRYGILFVLSSQEWTGYDYVTQVFYDILNDVMYMRTSSTKGSAWTEWAATYSTKNKPTAADVGAAPASHAHDDRYYTESEMDTKLSGKSNTGHTHDDRYYTESEMDTKLGGKANASHTHAAENINSGTLASDRLPVVPIAKGGTGASVASNAAKNLLVRTGISAAAVTDANTLTGVGIYKVYLDSTAEPADYNLPNRYGVLFVLSSMEWTGYDYVSQLFYDVLNNAYYQRTSTTNGANWTEWAQAYSNINKPTPADIGAAPASHDHSANSITMGTLAGEVVANAQAQTNLANPQVRSISAGTADLTAGTTTLQTGTLYVKYKT